MDLKVWILSLVTGVIVGVVFTLFRLPIPAPPVLSGILGIVGIWLGAQVVDWVKGFWQ
ncbi:XapX domain-containing protein [Tumebacillus permanentifrigoris]|uniref:XapX domain-containing protein n=1 Tax=Tumebacillus permanentifrigoris TaxID=378543 RepID=A0A316DDS7_9BACL|nr:XapX domain-containing protein [Tumebacillus permanentifrigoris]